MGANGRPIKDWEQSHTRFRKIYNFVRLHKTRKYADMLIMASAFIHSHEEAKHSYQRNFCSEPLTGAERTVLEEVHCQIGLAEGFIQDNLSSKKYSMEAKDVMNNLMCSILLNHYALLVDELVQFGLLKEAEGEHFFEHIDHELVHLQAK